MKALCLYGHRAAQDSLWETGVLLVYLQQGGLDLTVGAAFTSIVEVALDGAIYRDVKILFEKVKADALELRDIPVLPPLKESRIYCGIEAKGKLLYSLYLSSQLSNSRCSNTGIQDLVHVIAASRQAAADPWDFERCIVLHI